MSAGLILLIQFTISYKLSNLLPFCLHTSSAFNFGTRWGELWMWLYLGYRTQLFPHSWVFGIRRGSKERSLATRKTWSTNSSSCCYIDENLFLESSWWCWQPSRKPRESLGSHAAPGCHSRVCNSRKTVFPVHDKVWAKKSLPVSAYIFMQNTTLHFLRMSLKKIKFYKNHIL